MANRVARRGATIRGRRGVLILQHPTAIISSGSVGSLSVSFAQAPRSGSVLVACFMSAALNTDANTTGPTGWTRMASAAGAANNPRVSIWTKTAGASESTTITFTVATAATLALDIYEMKALTATLDQSSPTVNASATHLTVGPTAALAAAGYAFCAIATNTGAGGFKNTWTNGFARTTGNLARLTVATEAVAAGATPSTDETWTNSVPTAGVLVSLEAA